MPCSLAFFSSLVSLDSHRKREIEGAALVSTLRLRPNLALVHFDDVFRDEQAEPRTLDIHRGVQISAFEFSELGEQNIHFILGQANAIVRYREIHVEHILREKDFYAPALLRVLDGIRNQVCYDLFQA